MRLNKIKIFSLIFILSACLVVGLVVYSQENSFFDISLNEPQKGIFVVSINKDYFAKNSDIYVSKSLETVEEAAIKSNAKVAINAGFFDPVNTKTISYVVKNNKIIENPEDNEHLTESEDLKPYLDKIFNRAEFRVLNCPIDKIFQNGKIISAENNFQVANHFENQDYKKNCDLKYSIQAGPMLLPNIDLEKEFFVLKKDGKVVRQSASALQKFARSAIAVKKDKVLLVAVSNEAPITLPELADFMKKLKVEQAMAFDGGSSTSLYINYTLAGMASDKPTFSLTSAKDHTARKVKSILIVK